MAEQGAGDHWSSPNNFDGGGRVATLIMLIVTWPPCNSLVITWLLQIFALCFFKSMVTCTCYEFSIVVILIFVVVITRVS